MTCLLLTACGGGGGGGGGAGGPGGGPGQADDSVAFLGFSFRSASLGTTSVPPLEDPGASPPQLGAPLDLVVIFRFDGVPQGPFSQQTLPIWTTPDEVTPLAGVPGTSQTLLAKGSYSLVVDPQGGAAQVEFRPFVPTAPLQIDLSAPPEAVPGLLPGSQYHARVNTLAGSSIPNLKGPGGEVLFGTTSNAAAYYPQGVGAGAPPKLVASLPEDGASDFQPATFGDALPGVVLPDFPVGPSDLLLTFDQPVAPTLANLVGEDLDGDGVEEPVFFLRGQGTRLMLAGTVAADSFGSHPAFESLTALEPGFPALPATDGADIVVHDGPDGLLGKAPAALGGQLASLAPGADASLLYGVLAVDGGSDRLTVVDHVLGDPSAALPAQAADPDVDGSLDTGLDELVGLTTLADGRLLAFDRVTRRVHELRPAVVRRRPAPGQPTPLAPLLVDLAVGDGSNGLFRSEPLLPSGVASLLDVLDLAAAPSGELYALAVLHAGALPSLIRLAPVDPDSNGQFGEGEAGFSGLAEDVLLELGADYVDVAFIAPDRLLALDADAGQVDLIDLQLGGVVAVAAADLQRAPARALAVGFVDFDVDATLTANGGSGAILRVEPRGVLPFGTELALMQRNSFTSLAGVNAWNDAGAPPAGARQLLRFSTAAPLGDPGLPVDDVFLEGFTDTSFESQTPSSLSPAAEWGALLSDGSSIKGLRASVGLAESQLLGDFVPSTGTEFNAQLAYKRGKNPPESEVNIAGSGYQLVLLDTDVQNFPLQDGSTPGTTQPVTIVGGQFTFRDFIIPEGVRVVAKGRNPLRITATGRVEIHGLLDVAGTDGLGDDTFDTGFLPVPGGPGGPGAGRGGDAHQTLFDPKGPGSIDQFVTPERAERGQGPVVQSSGKLSFAPIGGHGGLSTLGYDPNGQGFPKLDNTSNDEHHRPPGGGGGSFYFRGQQARDGSGVYLVQSDSTWFPFSRCPTNNKQTDALYGNEENRVAGTTPNNFLQCVYMEMVNGERVPWKPGGAGGDLVFKDGDKSNDYIGPGGELEVLIGGQGGGGGGTRIDSMRHFLWSLDSLGSPVLPNPPHYPKLFLGVRMAPTLYDAKGGGGGGGGGGVQIRSFGDIVIGRTGRINARGGHGGGGEVVQNSSFAGGGGGGSGGAVLLQAAGEVILEADATNLSALYADLDGDMGATVDVSGGFGRDARTSGTSTGNLTAFSYEYTRSDGGQGGFGLIQLQEGSGDGLPTIQQGAFPYARMRSVAKLGKWTGDSAFLQAEHNEFTVPNNIPVELRYIDMLHYREFRPEGSLGNPPRDRFYVLNGSWPPLIPGSSAGAAGPGPAHEYPSGSGQYWQDTPMYQGPYSAGERVVLEPEPFKIIDEYNGYTQAFFEQNFPSDHPEFPDAPGTTYKDQVIPMSIDLVQPDGSPFRSEVDGQVVFDADNLIDRLPVIHPDLAPPPFGTISRGTSQWLDFNGVALRERVDGVTPPFFLPFHGTYNAGLGPVPSGKEGRLRLGAVVPQVDPPAHYVADAGLADPGLTPGPGAAPYNDVKVNAPELGQENVLTDNAHVSVWFQGAYPVRAGSHVPDEASLSTWVADLTELDGYPLVRFQVRFDLGAAPLDAPYGPGSARPLVDYVRVRAQY